jgi:hypothetical protein
MLGTYVTYQSLFLHLGGAALLSLGYCWLSYRLVCALYDAFTSYRLSAFCFLTYVRGYLFFLLPWLAVLFSYRASVVALPVELGGSLAQMTLLLGQFVAA